MDMWDLELYQWLTMAVLPLVGFAIGARLTAAKLYDPNRWLRKLRGGDSENSEILDALENIRDEIGDLAERQEYTERLVTRAIADRSIEEREPTPV
jgi:hypothetical protein